MGSLKNFTRKPPHVRIYTGPDIPTAYDPAWQYFTNLTSDQVSWFQAQPEWQNFLSYVAIDKSAATINANVSETTITTALSANKVALNGPKL